jgi:hypothetical protein
MESKVCPRCKESKSVSDFQKCKRNKDGLQYHCKVCRKYWDNGEIKQKYNRERYHKYEHLYRDSVYKRHFGITLKDYEDMLFKQNGVCAICLKECKTGQRLAVDHCHTTGKVRGLLCMECNRGLGAFKDNVVVLTTAIKYLEDSRV